MTFCQCGKPADGYGKMPLCRACSEELKVPLTEDLFFPGPAVTLCGRVCNDWQAIPRSAWETPIFGGKRCPVCERIYNQRNGEGFTLGPTPASIHHVFFVTYLRARKETE